MQGQEMYEQREHFATSGPGKDSLQQTAAVIVLEAITRFSARRGGLSSALLSYEQRRTG